MPVRSSQANRANGGDDIQKVRLDYGEAGDLNLEVRRGKFTKGFQRKIMRHFRDQEAAEAFDMFFEVVVSWDMLDDNDQPLPLTPEGTDCLSLATISGIIVRIQEVINPNSETSTSS